MKNVKILMLLAFVSLAMISCNKDDDGGNNPSVELENELIFDGETFPIKVSTVGSFSTDEDSFFDLYFGTSAYNEETGTFEEVPFQLVNFEILSENDELEERTYNFSEPVVPGTFSDLSGVRLNVDDNLSAEEEFDLIGGSITILEITNSTIEATFEGTASSYAEGEREVEFSGHYKGSYIED